MQPEHLLDTARQRYLNLIPRYLQGRTEHMGLWQCWPTDRDAVWQAAWNSARSERCREREAVAEDKLPPLEPADPRRLPRLIDRLSSLRAELGKVKGKEKDKDNEKDAEEAFRASVARLLAAYYCPGSDSSEGRSIDHRRRIAVFERPLPEGSGHRYPCTVRDIRARLAAVPEYDLEGIWAIGLAPPTRRKCRAYGTYYSWMPPIGKPVILLYSWRSSFKFKLRYRDDPGYIERNLSVELEYGMKIEHDGGKAICCWPDGALRQYIVNHVLVHEIGHHVQYEQRWRAGSDRWLPRRLCEQFAEDYAIRSNRSHSIPCRTAPELSLPERML